MKLTKLLLVPAVALGLCSASCVPDVLSIQVKQALADAIDGECVLTTGSDMQLARGVLDLGYVNPNNPAYMLALRVVSNVEATELTGGGSSYNPADRNDFYLEKVTFHYTGEGVPEVTSEMSLSGLIQAQSEADFAFNILSSEAYRRLVAMATPDGREVVVEIKLSGKFAHGAEYETAPFAFPLTVYASMAPICDSAVHDLVSAGPTDPPCQNWGQDGIGYVCVCKDSAGCPEGTTRNPDTCVCE